MRDWHFQEKMLYFMALQNFENKRMKESRGMKKMNFLILGMHCASCAASVERAVKKMDGVSKVYVNLATKTMTLDAEESVTPAMIIECVKDNGFNAQLIEDRRKTQEDEEAGTRYFLRFLVALFFSVLLFCCAMSGMLGLSWLPVSPLANAFIQIALLIPVLFAGYTFYLYGFRTLAKLAPNMDSLIAIGTSAAILYSVYLIVRGDFEHLYFDTAGMIIALIMLGKFLEARSRGKASGAIAELMKLSPETACLMIDEREALIPVSELKTGDRVRVRPGERVPADGVIEEGSTTIDESMLTGESMPVEKTSGSSVTGGSMNKNGSFIFRVTHTGEDSVISRIIAMVQDAQSSRPPIARLADTISGFFVWGVILIAAVTFCVWFFSAGETFAHALSFALAVLVIACPCALGLATPIALIVGIGRGAKLGILIKSGKALESAGKTTTVVLDKTGTITEGRPDLSGIQLVPNGRFTEGELLAMAAAAEKGSEHPLADAVVRAAEERKLALPAITDFKALPGHGVFCRIQEKEFILGNLSFMQTHKIDVGMVDTSGSDSVIFAAYDRHLIGVLRIADRIKPTTAKATQALHRLGVKVVMLTGDHKAVAASIARTLRIDEFYAELLPNAKAEVIRKLQDAGERVAMVGDGINDAPALAQADTGIAIASGTDIAMESADIVLMQSDLCEVPAAIALSRATMRIIRENLFWAFIYNVVCIPLAAGVFVSFLGWTLNPIFGALAMACSSVSVVLNALRLRSFRPPESV